MQTRKIHAPSVKAFCYTTILLCVCKWVERYRKDSGPLNYFSYTNSCAYAAQRNERFYGGKKPCDKIPP